MAKKTKPSAWVQGGKLLVIISAWLNLITAVLCGAAVVFSLLLGYTDAEFGILIAYTLVCGLFGISQREYVKFNK